MFAAWQKWLLDEIRAWRDEWLPVLENLGTPGSVPSRSSTFNHDETVLGVQPTNEKAAELAGLLKQSPENFSREASARFLEQIISADATWPAKRKTILRKPLEGLFDEAKFLLLG